MIVPKFATYVLVGVLCALIDIVSMQLLMRLGINYLIASTLGFFTGFIANFLLHTNITFGATYSHGTLARYASVVVANLAISLLIVHLFQRTLEMPVLGKLVSLPVIAVIGFILGKRWVFR